MADDPKSCDRCGEPHERCIGHNRSGGPCGLWPLAGQRVCGRHGGKSPQALAKAQERVAEAEADQVLATIWPGLNGARPVKDPIESLQRLAGALESAVDVVGEKVNELNHLAAGTSLTQMRGEVVLLERLLGQLRQALEGMARLGIEEKQIQLQQAQADFIIGAFKAGLAAVASQLLTPGDKDAMLRAFLGALGVDVRALEGEVSA